MRSVLMPEPASMLPGADFTSFVIATACGIHSSTNRASAPPPASSKPDAKSPSELASSAPGCTGPWLEPPVSSLSAAAVSVGGSKTSGNAEMILSPLDPQICAVHPPAARLVGNLAVQNLDAGSV